MSFEGVRGGYASASAVTWAPPPLRAQLVGGLGAGSGIAQREQHPPLGRHLEHAQACLVVAALLGRLGRGHACRELGVVLVAAQLA